MKPDKGSVPVFTPARRPHSHYFPCTEEEGRRPGSEETAPISFRVCISGPVEDKAPGGSGRKKKSNQIKESEVFAALKIHRGKIYDRQE